MFFSISKKTSSRKDLDFESLFGFYSQWIWVEEMHGIPGELWCKKEMAMVWCFTTISRNTKFPSVHSKCFFIQLKCYFFITFSIEINFLFIKKRVIFFGQKWVMKFNNEFNISFRILKILIPTTLLNLIWKRKKTNILHCSAICYTYRPILYGAKWTDVFGPVVTKWLNVSTYTNT